MRYRGKTYAAANAKCPYYRYEKLTNVVCDGMYKSICKMSFKTEDDKDSYIINNCMKYPNECPLAIGMDLMSEDTT